MVESADEEDNEVAWLKIAESDTVLWADRPDAEGNDWGIDTDDESIEGGSADCSICATESSNLAPDCENASS